MPVVALPYIDVDEKGVARIAGSRIKVRFIGAEHTRQGMTPAEIHEAHEHISLEKIHAALAYYFAHKDSMDAELDEDDRYADEMRAQASPWPIAERLRRESYVK